MSLIVRPRPTMEGPVGTVVNDDDTVLERIRFDLVQPLVGQRLGFQTEACEHVGVIVGGRLTVTCQDKTWPALGRRRGVFDGSAATFYVPIRTEYWIEAASDGVEIALVRFPATKRFEPFVVAPHEVTRVTVGEPPCRRHLEFAIGQNAEGRVDQAVVLEVFTDPGNWAGTPPHKHDQQRPPEETAIEELYHFRFDPPQGFGVQCLYQDTDDRTASIVRDGDTALLPSGYHPVCVLHGYRMYYLVAMAGAGNRDVVQWFDPAHRWQLEGAAGVADMRSSFRSCEDGSTP